LLQLENMDINSELKKVLKDGQITIGEKTAKKAVLSGKAKMVIVTSSASVEMKTDLKRYASLSGVKYYEYPESSKDLGYTCAKPFPVSVIAIMKPGSSKILDAK